MWLFLITYSHPLLGFQQIGSGGARTATPIFKDVANEAGLKFQHYNGMTGKFYLPEITGSGAALFDFDNDGDLDVYLVQGNILEPNTKPNSTVFPWREAESPRGRLFRNDLAGKKLPAPLINQKSERKKGHLLKRPLHQQPDIF